MSESATSALACPRCAATDKQVKNGHDASGRQRVRCNLCRKTYSPHPLGRHYGQETRRQAVALYVDGNNFRRIARTLGVHHQSVINWVNAYQAALPDTLPQPQSVATVEMDELYTFVGSKKTRPTS